VGSRLVRALADAPDADTGVTEVGRIVGEMVTALRK
jgi:hypothetical protein